MNNGTLWQAHRRRIYTIKWKETCFSFSPERKEIFGAFYSEVVVFVRREATQATFCSSGSNSFCVRCARSNASMDFTIDHKIYYITETEKLKIKHNVIYAFTCPYVGRMYTQTERGKSKWARALADRRWK